MLLWAISFLLKKFNDFQKRKNSFASKWFRKEEAIKWIEGAGLIIGLSTHESKQKLLQEI